MDLSSHEKTTINIQMQQPIYLKSQHAAVCQNKQIAFYKHDNYISSLSDASTSVYTIVYIDITL